MITSFIILLIGLLAAIFVIFEITRPLINYILIIDFVKGFVIGGLYNADDYPDENITEHTIQIVLFFLSFTFMWESEINSN
jgi:hypothetical protein